MNRVGDKKRIKHTHAFLRVATWPTFTLEDGQVMTFIGASLRPPPPHCSLPSPEELLGGSLFLGEPVSWLSDLWYPDGESVSTRQRSPVNKIPRYHTLIAESRKESVSNSYHLLL